MDDFPLNLNGKVDVKALPTPEFAIEEIVEPKTYIEIKLFEIISNILKTDKFGITTDLVRLGLNSLSSIKIAYEIASNWGVQLSIKELNDAKDIQNLASLIDAPTELTEVVHEKQELYPLSQNQLGVYFESIKHPDKLIYNTTSRAFHLLEHPFQLSPSAACILQQKCRIQLPENRFFHIPNRGGLNLFP